MLKNLLLDLYKEQPEIDTFSINTKPNTQRVLKLVGGVGTIN